MTILQRIVKYRLIYYLTQKSESEHIAQITLFDSMSEIIGIIHFYKEGQEIPKNTVRINFKPTRVYLHASENQLDRIVDMLRNEEPCSVYYSSPKHAYVCTGEEPVGEEETQE